MKNIHILPTDKPIKNVGDLVKDKYGDIHIFTKNDGKEYGKTTTKINIYITSDEEIKEGDWVKNITIDLEIPFKLDADGIIYTQLAPCEFKKIIITTDQDLIKDGVQAIDDEFLEWFVKNQSCEEVEVKMNQGRYFDYGGNVHITNAYKIIIPKEEIKQELPKTEIDWSRFPKSTQKQVGFTEPNIINDWLDKNGSPKIAKQKMNAVDIEKLNQLISRTDMSGNDKVKWLVDFIDGREAEQETLQEALLVDLPNGDDFFKEAEYTTELPNGDDFFKNK
jgi:hypothetical protein